MKVWIFFFAIGFAPFVLSKEEMVSKACGRNDFQCLKHSTENFLEKSSSGIPEYGIRPTDPLIIPSYTYEVSKEIRLYYHFNNINVTGLKNETMTGIKIVPETKYMELQLKCDVRIVADATLEVTMDNKRFTGGVYTATSNVLIITSYNYEITKDEKDVEHFIVGPETIKCENIGDPNVSLNKEFADAVLNGVAIPETEPPTDVSANMRQEIVCNIIKLAYVDIIHNIRAAAKILPRTAYFTDL